MIIASVAMAAVITSEAGRPRKPFVRNSLQQNHQLPLPQITTIHNFSDQSFEVLNLIKSLFCRQHGADFDAKLDVAITLFLS